MEELEEEKYIHNEHDKLFKRILDRINEVESVIKKTLGNETEHIEIEAVRNELTTRDYRGRMVDVLYKLKDKEVYFLIEHQSTQNTYMAYKIFEYEAEIITRSHMQNVEKSKKIANKYIKLLESKIKEEGGKGAMVETMRALREDRRRTIMEARNTGKKAGILEGEKSGKIQDAKNMLRENIDIDTIVRVTGLKKEDFV